MGMIRWLRGRSFGITLFFLILAFFFVVLWRDIVVSKYPGEQGVYWSRFFGGTSDLVLREGTHLKFPWDEIFIYSTRIRESHGSTRLQTKDGMEMYVEWSVRYRVDPARLPELHRKLGPQYAEKVAIPEVVSSLRRVLGNYSADQIYAKDEMSLIGEINDQVKSRVEKFHPILFETILLLRLEMPEAMSNGIVEKLLHEQQFLSYAFRLKSEEQERKRKIIEAQGIREFETASRMSMLKWRGIEATETLAKSPNSKIILMGTGQNNLPLLLNADGPSALVATEHATARGK
jgi:regulator of protease activity HflC (stomatin/prohibitin superfamily)